VSTGHDFDAIWREAGPAIWRAVYAYAGGRRDVADDAIAEAFARAIVQDAGIRDPVPYLYRLAFRIAAEDLKRMRKTIVSGETGDTAVEDDHTAAEVVHELRRLTPGQRAAIYLHYRMDLPVREVAAITGASVAAVKVQLMRGRRRLAGILADDDQEVPR
jgi:RNA polymerase sigma-70 factor (ECF subfamily)